ncbi:MAG: competence/damage-inducible protein A, partial [Rubripirellula sp.]
MTQNPSQLIAEVVSIGDEMTSGARLDTNAQWLSRRLAELGVHVAFHSTVGDTLQHNIDVFRIAAQRADIVVATGGLGPTRDDLTREALADAVDQPLEMSDSAMQHIESMFARRDREMPERNRVQAMFPRGSREIFNPQGTAPGIDLSVPRPNQTDSRVYALPGVPAEMKRMFDQTVAPRILTQSGSATKIHQHVMKFFGTGESDMERRLGEMISRDRQPRVGITVSTATISLRITATGESDEQCLSIIDKTRSEILERVAEFHFGDGEDFEQYHAIDHTLRQRGETLMVIELWRAAPLGDWFASLGATPAYRGGLSLATSSDLNLLFGGESEEAAIDRLKKAYDVEWILVVDSYPELDRQSDLPQPASEIRLVVVAPGGETLATKTTM